MKKFAKRILRAGSTTALALLIVSGGVPVKPFSQMFDRAVITAFANEGKYSFTLPDGLEYESDVKPDEDGKIDSGTNVTFVVDDDHYLDENSFVALDANGENKLTPDEYGVYSVTVTGDTAIYASLAEKYIKGACGDDFSKSYKNITYTYNKQTKVMTLSGTGKMKENTYLYFDNIGKDVKKVVIGEGITNIGESAFYEFENMEEIEIGKDVKSIDSYAFQSCKSLKKVVLPEELTTIGKMGFYRCSALEEIVIPESCQNIGEAAFDSCKNLRSIKLPYGIAEIKSQTFKYCESLETIEIPESVEKIGVEAMYECKSLKSIDLPEKLTEIGAGAFAYNYALEEVKFSDLLKTIGDKAFFGCQKIKEVNFPNTLESIGKEAFYGNNSIQSVKIPANVTCIGESAFIYCENILSIEIAESEKDQTIGKKAFFYCKSVISVKIPSSVVSIGIDALFSIKYNARIEYNGTMAQWKAIGGKDATSVTIVPSSYAYTITTVKDTEHFDMIVRNFNTADSESQATGGDAGDELKVDISNIKEGYYIKYVECSYDGGETWTKLTNSYFKLSEGNLIVRAVAEEIPSINYVTANNGKSGDVKALPLNQYTSPFINDNYSVYYIDGDYKSIDYSSVRLYNNDGVTLVLADDVTFETSAIMNSKLDYPNGIAYFSDITITKPVGAKGTGTISAYYIDASNITLRAGIIETQNVSAYGANELLMREVPVASGVLTLDFSDENSKFCGSICDIEGNYKTIGSVVIPEGRVMTDGTNTFPPSEYTVGEINSTDSGTTTIMLTDKDGKTYTVSSPATFKLITNTDPVIETIPTASEITYGQTLAQSNLSNGAAKLGETVIEGDFAWNDPTIVPAVSDSNKTEYTVTFTPKDSNNINKAFCKVKLTVNKADIPAEAVTPPTKIDDLEYTGSAMNLVNAGSVAGNIGTIWYAVTDSTVTTAPEFDGDSQPADKKWSTAIPTATEAGTYYVWYKAVGDNEHSDSEAKVISVTIEQKVEEHTHKLEIFDAKEPTCTENGYKEHYECTECGKWFEDRIGHAEITDKSSFTIKAIGHKWDSGEITKEATYDEDGEKTYTCQNDPSHTKIEIIPKKTRTSDNDSDNTTNENDSSSGTGDDSVNNGENTADTNGSSTNVSRRIGGSSDSSSSSDSSGSGSSSSDSGSSSSSSSSGSSSKTNTTAQAKVDQVNNVTSFKVPENHQVESGVPASDIGGKWGNSANTDTWTYTKSDGTLAKGEWLSLDYNGLRYWYYFNDDGNMHTNWFDYKGERFYLMPDKDGWRGRMATGWKNIDNKWYYFDILPGSSQGRLHRSTVTPDGHTVGADGAWNGVGTTPLGQE